MSKTFYIVDGHSQIFRAYYAPFRELTSPAGEPTRATYVFTVMLLGLIRQRRPDYLVVALDSPRESLDRSGLFPQYKATREAPLFNADFSPTPAGEAFVDLVTRRWTTEGSGRVDAGGRITFTGYHGRYRVQAGGRQWTVDLAAENPSATL